MKPAAPLLLGLLLALGIPAPTPAQGFVGDGYIPPSTVANPADTPITPAGARIWTALAQPLSMPFHAETPLEDVLKYIQSATQNPDQAGALQFYVDPKALQEAEKTLQSPVSLNLEGIPVSVSLKLLLDQLDLYYEVRSEGFIQIGYNGNLVDPDAERNDAIARELHNLRQEVAALRQEIGNLRATLSSPATPTTPTASGGTGFSATSPTQGGFR